MSGRIQLWFVLNLAALTFAAGAIAERARHDHNDWECPSRAECIAVENEVFKIRRRPTQVERKLRHRGNGSSCEHRIRRNFMTLDKSERRRYINAILTLSTHPHYKKKYFDLLQIHHKFFCKALHCKVYFLPWHRWYILRYENLLREVDSSLTLAYWDWSMVAGRPWDANLWDDNDHSLGGNGNPVDHAVDTGPFRQPGWQMIPGAGQDSNAKLKRYFGYAVPNIASALHLAILFKYYKPREFVKFITVFQTWHNNVHCSAIGWNSTMCNRGAAWAPEFFLHHTFVDKYWSEWQEQGDEYKYSDYYVKQTWYMQGTNSVLAGDVLDLNNQEGGVCVTYEKSEDDWIHKKLRNLSLDQLREIRGVQIPPHSKPPVAELHSRARISKSFATTCMNEFIKSNALRQPITLKDMDGTDKARAFRLHDLLEMSNRGNDS